MDDLKAKLKALESEKDEKIARWIALQDQAERLNDDIYKVGCDVEMLNARIDALKAEIHRAQLAKTVKP